MASRDGGDSLWSRNASTVKTLPSPDNEQNVRDQTEDVFKNFMYQSWRLDQSREQFANTPAVPQLTNFTADPLSPAAQVGRQLAKIGDDVNQKYQDEFDRMINNLSIDQNTAYDAFAGVARRLVEGGLNWGRILTLFSFGYRIVVRVIGFGEGLAALGNIFRDVVSNVVRFVTDAAQGIVQWIARQGGWSSALEYVPSVSWRVLAGIGVLAGLTLGAAWYLKSGGK